MEKTDRPMSNEDFYKFNDQCLELLNAKIAEGIRECVRLRGSPDGPATRLHPELILGVYKAVLLSCQGWTSYAMTHLDKMGVDTTELSKMLKTAIPAMTEELGRSYDRIFGPPSSP